MGTRERADVLLPPFEMAIREGGARSVMHAYTDTDGMPSAADETLLTELLRDTWDFDGTVVADYFGIAFLKTLHGIAADWADAAGAALRAGVDVELPTVKTFGAPRRRRHRRQDPGGGRRSRPAPRPRPEGTARPPRPGLEPGPARTRRRRPRRPGSAARTGRPGPAREP
ncbi:hypothetical protein SHKM778_55480 [Streptomyces sp. KM77-8]|uniref:Glycoside hydrolase family 3 N-terminal domain-containing protein n=1 Tax=Streptomyces haneummycinicus TaxID=3074435 RepID=A0AAT9HNW4_9ACTN